MERKTVRIKDKIIGDGNPVFIVAEIGLNHNGDIEIAKKLIDVAALAGCDAVKFQKRKPEDVVTDDQRDVIRETPWGTMSYLEYRKRIEFGPRKYAILDAYATEKGVLWFASPWEETSVEFLEDFRVPCFKVPSACLTDHNLLRKIRKAGKPILLSTGMSTMKQIEQAVEVLGGTDDLVILHCTSSYPAATDELNLRAIRTLKNRFDCPIGYSGHEIGLQATYAAVALGADVVERHITLDRAMWGTDQAASVEPFGLWRLVRDIRIVERALGDGEKRVYDSELPIMKKLRRRDDTRIENDDMVYD